MMQETEFNARKFAVLDGIAKTLGALTFLPVNRETALVKTKLDEAQMWLERVQQPPR
jgi:hypothetical protein